MHSQPFPLFILFMILISTGCTKDECEFHYNKYFIDFSEESKQQHPFLEKDSIIIESIFGIDTLELKKDLAGEGSRIRKSDWTCAEDSTITEDYDFYYTQKVVHFKPVGSPYTLAMSLVTRPDKYDPMKYAEYFELLVAKNFNSFYYDDLRLIRFMTNDREANCSITQFGEFHEELTIDSVTYENVWYNGGEFLDHRYDVYYSTDVGLIKFYIDFFSYDILGVF